MAAKKPKSNRKPKSGQNSGFGMSDSEFDKMERRYDERMDRLHAGTKKTGPKVNFGDADRLQQYKNKERIKYEKTYEFNKPKKSVGQGTGKVEKIRNAKAGGRAQPKGTQPKGMAAPPRTGPSSGGGGQSSRYSRLTGGGLNKHGR